MKHIPTVIFIIGAIAVSLIITSIIIELRKEKDLLQVELDGRKKANEQERDSLQSQLAITRDSLSVAIETIELAHLETLKARALALQAQKYYHMIKFVTHTDSSRTAELKGLYKSYEGN